MSWIGLVYYQDRVDQIGGKDTDDDAELHYKIKHYVKGKCERVEVYHNDQTIFPAGIKQIKKGLKR